MLGFSFSLCIELIIVIQKKLTANFDMIGICTHKIQKRQQKKNIGVLISTSQLVTKLMDFTGPEKRQDGINFLRNAKNYHLHFQKIKMTMIPIIGKVSRRPSNNY